MHEEKKYDSLNNILALVFISLTVLLKGGKKAR